MIMSDRTIRAMLAGLVGGDCRDERLVNPASLDVRVGKTLELEAARDAWLGVAFEAAAREGCPHAWSSETVGFPRWRCRACLGESVLVEPGGFLLASTLETITVPNGYVLDLKLKSSTAREGWDHSLAFHVDPGWSGVLTMEIQNRRKYTPLRLACGQRFAQVMLHSMDRPAERPYAGRYQGAAGVERAKAE